MSEAQSTGTERERTFLPAHEIGPSSAPYRAACSVDSGGPAAVVDRGVLAKIDRRILSELDHASGIELAKIPLSDAEWSTWRRYCDVVGITMGKEIAGIVAYERGSVVGTEGGDWTVFGAETER